jgi:hypothetical protein
MKEKEEKQQGKYALSISIVTNKLMAYKNIQMTQHYYHVARRIKTVDDEVNTSSQREQLSSHTTGT